MQLYTLYATPGQTADFVMVASLSTIEAYLGRQVPRTFVEGDSSFTIDDDYSRPSVPRVGHWLVCEGACLPKPAPVAPDENIGSTPSGMFREQQLDLVRSVTSRLTPSQQETLTDMCMVARARGENSSVWHQSALMFNRPCNCAACNPKGPQQ